MSILDKLMEKKDLNNYLGLRIDQLYIHIKNITDYEERRREDLKLRFISKIEELQWLKESLANDNLKQDCKIIYKFLEKEP